MLHIDPIASGDPVAFALTSIAQRLPALLERAGAAELAAEVDAAALRRIMPEVEKEALRLRRVDGAETRGPEEAGP